MNYDSIGVVGREKTEERESRCRKWSALEYYTNNFEVYSVERDMWKMRSDAYIIWFHVDYGVDMKDKCVIHLQNKKEESLLWPQHMKEFLKQT